jgi:hypothetical protein
VRSRRERLAAEYEEKYVKSQRSQEIHVEVTNIPVSAFHGSANLLPALLPVNIHL